mgnify:CR=1 FL=1
MARLSRREFRAPSLPLASTTWVRCRLRACLDAGSKNPLMSRLLRHVVSVAAPNVHFSTALASIERQRTFPAQPFRLSVPQRSLNRTIQPQSAQIFLQDGGRQFHGVPSRPSAFSRRTAILRATARLGLCGDFPGIPCCLKVFFSISVWGNSSLP